ncbi:MAG: nucleotidyltransferase domain-containing protein [Candidatus Latescibacterota bacterium]|nr:MAG: nucleotidyltransferase domain-containing protein [Candidatus Latescibacterota bacterium]
MGKKLEVDHILKVLREYFSSREDVAFSFLFGSYADGTATSLSDVDVAVYFYPKRRRPVEFEEPIYYEAEDRIWADLDGLLKKEVELVVLNRVPATVSASAIRGIPIVINDWGLYLDFMEVVTSEAMDFREMLIRDFLEEMDEGGVRKI